ncbi:hypothetical protein PENTCL1PPCAC_19250, partial [Pristionchus entomophagus]
MPRRPRRHSPQRRSVTRRPPVRRRGGPRIVAVHSACGTGATLTAAAMAAEVARNRDATAGVPGSGGVQLLLAQRNFAVDLVGDKLKKMTYSHGRTVYSMKLTKMLNPHDPAPFDFFDLMNTAKLEEWKSGKVKMVARDNYFHTREECLTHHKQEYENGLDPENLLSTVETVLQELYTPSKLCSALGRVDRIIIDEAATLSEAAMFCIMRRFPNVRLIRFTIQLELLCLETIVFFLPSCMMRRF